MEEHTYEEEYQSNQKNRNKITFGFDFGGECSLKKGSIVDTFCTGCEECDSISSVYECGGIYNSNYGDIPGNRTGDCFLDCSHCKEKAIPRTIIHEMNFDSLLLAELYHKAMENGMNIDSYINQVLSKYCERKLSDTDLMCIDCFENDDGHCTHETIHCKNYEEMCKNWYHEHPNEELPDL